MQSTKFWYIFTLAFFLSACGGSNSGDTSQTAKEIALEKITAYAENGNNPSPTLQDYIDAGVTGVNDTNLAEINTIVDGLVAEDVDTQSEIQSLTTQLAISIIPTVDAGQNQTVQVNNSVTIEGNASDIDGTIASYVWSLGTTTLSTSASFNYVPTEVGTDELTLTVTDNNGNTASDTIEVVVTATPNSVPVNNAGGDDPVVGDPVVGDPVVGDPVVGDPVVDDPVVDTGENPVANAGEDKEVKVNLTITIAGTATDSDGTIQSYEWKIGSTVLATTASFDYTPTSVGVDAISLTVTDNDGNISSNSLTVTVIPNLNPTANAGGDQSIKVNRTITIAGTGTDDDGTVESYEWKKGSTTLATTASFDYSPTTSGTDTITLTVTDNDGNTASDSIEVTVIANVNPTVNAGVNKSIKINRSITITGTGNDTDGTIDSYEWKKGSTILATTASFSYTPTTAGNDTLTLTVTDDDGSTASDSLAVTVIPNINPTAEAGVNQNVTVNHVITITGTGTDTDGTIQSYEWKKGSTILATTASFNYIPTSVGTDKLTLTVTDDDGISNSDSINVVVVANLPPTINAGEDKKALKGDILTIEGTASDSDGSIAKYQWRRGGTILANTKTFTYNTTVAGVVTDTLIFIATDDDGESSTDTLDILIGIEIPDSDKFLTFINTGEVDANVTEGFGAIGNEIKAINYYNKIDPDNRKLTLEDWYTENCFIKPSEEYINKISPRTPPNCGPDGFGDTAFAIYLNNADLNFGRRMALRSNTVDVIGSAEYSLTQTATSCVENYPSIEDSITQTGLLATVCMEYSPPDNEPMKDKFTKFYVYGPDGNRVTKVDLDGRGEKYQPGNCLTCHGGSLDPENTGSGSGDAVGNLNSAFIPWDLDNFKFSTTDPDFSKDAQEEEFRKLNQAAMHTYRAFDPDPDNLPVSISDEGAKATREMIRGWYSMAEGDYTIPENKFDGEFIPDAWLSKAELYSEVVAPTCRACHVQRGLSSPDAIDFATSAKFESYNSLINTHVFQQASMPLAKRTFDVFWDNLRPGNQAQILWDELRNEGVVTGSINIPGDPIPNIIANSTAVETNPFDPTKTIIFDGRRSLFAASYLWSVESSPAGATYTLTNQATSVASFKLTGTPTYGSYTFRLTVMNSRGTSEFEERTINLVSARTPLDFSDDILPILETNCGSCHFAPGLASAISAFPMNGSVSEIFAEVSSRVSTSNPTNSLLFRKASISPGDSHTGGKPIPVGSADYNTILEWIRDDSAAGP